MIPIDLTVAATKARAVALTASLAAKETSRKAKTAKERARQAKLEYKSAKKIAKQAKKIAKKAYKKAQEAENLLQESREKEKKNPLNKTPQTKVPPPVVKNQRSKRLAAKGVHIHTKTGSLSAETSAPDSQKLQDAAASQEPVTSSENSADASVFEPAA